MGGEFGTAVGRELVRDAIGGECASEHVDEAFGSARRPLDNWPVCVAIDDHQVCVSLVIEIVRTHTLERIFGQCRRSRRL